MNVHKKEEIAKLAADVFGEMQRCRRHLHKNPELSFEEFKTMDFVCSELTEIGISFEKNFGGTGVIAWLTGPNKELPYLAIRADMDALPIHEQNETEYKSTVDGVMHACGHDVHTAVLLGTARVLKKIEEKLIQPVLFVFQPGEEKAPGGASILIKEGLFQKWNIEKIIALHVYPEMEAGKVGFKKGLYMASCDEVHLTIHGKGGHAAMPHACTDVIQTGADLVRNLPLLIHRKCDPKIPMVLSFGIFEAKGATNVLPDIAVIKGTFRTMNEEWRERAITMMQGFSESLAVNSGTIIDFEIVRGYPFLVNNEDLTEEIQNKARTQLGDERLENLPIRLTAEDFSYYTHQVPATFFRLGVRNELKGIVHGVHHPKFDIDETAMITGVEVFVTVATK
ncbi:MAG: amidohydrolase [Bacteroidetes bacterium]|nr:amidohydrolase [Bacteroidota bacterium]